MTPASGMWAGRIGANAIITVDAKGDPAQRARHHSKDGELIQP